MTYNAKGISQSVTNNRPRKRKQIETATRWAVKAHDKAATIAEKALILQTLAQAVKDIDDEKI